MTRERRRPLKVGVELPIAVDKGRHGTPRWGDISQMARHAEEIGFDSIWIEDHLLFRHEGQPDQGVWEGWAIIAAIAAVTSRVEIGPLVSCMSFRNPAYLAKLADTIEEISGGRLILGVGAGWHEAEYRAFGYPFDHRVSRFEEGLRIVHGLLRHGKVDFVGQYHQARECELRPRGPRPGGPPILIGSTGERMLALLAQYGDLWNAYFTPTKNRPGGRGAAPGPGRRGMPQGGARPGDARPHGRRVRRHGAGKGRVPAAAAALDLRAPGRATRAPGGGAPGVRARRHQPRAALARAEHAGEPRGFCARPRAAGQVGRAAGPARAMAEPV